MTKQTMGSLIAALRKENNMTQAELAARMNVTDKAVSKWERDLCCPDTALLPTLAETLGITVEELLYARRAREAPSEAQRILGIVLKAVPLAMGVALVMLSMLDHLEADSIGPLAGIAIFCLALDRLRELPAEK